MKNILVVGSNNTDMVIKLPKLPTRGETITNGDFYILKGGKGANQAVAAARLGGNVTFITRVGNDVYGTENIHNFEAEGIDTKYITTDNQAHSGIAVIMVGGVGENYLAVAPGANNTLTPEIVSTFDNKIIASDIILLQLEIPIETNLYVAKLAKKHGKMVILNPAPATPLPREIFNYIDIFTPNETEAEVISGIKLQADADVYTVANALSGLGIKQVIITLGEKGVYVHREPQGMIVPAPKVQAVDTTAAGDTFNGGLAVALAEGKSIDEACKLGVEAASISVTRLGAQPSIPKRSEVKV
ncbi:MAG: ribokinase [Cytophagales bacterium]|nr:ribokinase [Cytophagales bacterium]